MKNIVLLFFFMLIPHMVLSQTPQVPTEDNAPEVTDNRLSDLPAAQDDRDSQVVLTHMIRKANWLNHVTIDVDHGVVYIKGKYDNKDHMKWLTDTAEKLPTILAVVNNADFEVAPVTDIAPYLKEWNALLSSFKKNMPKILVGIFLTLFFLVLGRYLQGGFSRIWSRRIKNPFLLTTITKVAFIPVWAFFFYMTLQILGLQRLATTIIGGTGVVGILFGLAFRGIAENYLSGILLAIRSPFTQGDHIKINDFQGLVQNLNMRGTTIMDFDGNLILIPNTTVIQSVVQNFSANTQKRSSFSLGVDHKESFYEVQSIILDVLKEIKGIKDDPCPLVVLDNLGPSPSMKLKVFFWFDASTFSEGNLKSLAISRIKDTLLAKGVLLRDEAREITFIHTEDEKLEKIRQSIQQRAEKKPSKEQNEAETRHEEELKKVAMNSSLPVNSSSANLLKQ